MQQEPKTLSVPVAGRLYFDLGKNASYEAAQRGEIPVIRIGSRLRVPIVALERMLEQAGSAIAPDGAGLPPTVSGPLQNGPYRRPNHPPGHYEVEAGLDFEPQQRRTKNRGFSTARNRHSRTGQGVSWGQR